MYFDFFGLKEAPFQLTPDPYFLFLSKSHARAKAYMDYTIWNRDSFVVITGEIGSGKTTLIQHLLSSIDDNVIVAKIHQTQLNEVEFYQAILVEFGFKPFDASKVELIDMLNSFLLDQYEQGRQVILIVDEAQNLTPRVLEEVRLMTGLETDKGKILNLILVGQPELKQTLDAPGMEQLAQRIRFRFHLKPLTEEETKHYIEHRLKVAGIENQKIFPASTMPIIYRYSGGIPRLINSLCDTALITAFVENKRTLTIELIEEALEELQWVPFSERARNKEKDLENALELGSNEVPKLAIYRRNGRVDEFPLDQDIMTLGRMPGNDVILEDTVVSGHHAKIITVHGTSILEDLNSTNGTYVNGQRVKKCVLKNGDILSLARSKMRYVNEFSARGNKGDTQVVSISGDNSPFRANMEKTGE